MLNDTLATLKTRAEIFYIKYKTIIPTYIVQPNLSIVVPKIRFFVTLRFTVHYYLPTHRLRNIHSKAEENVYIYIYPFIGSECVSNPSSLPISRIEIKC